MIPIPDQQNDPSIARVLLSRQPIYQQDMSLLGYELLFRDGDCDRAVFSDGTQATALVIVNAFMEIGMDEMVGRSLAFINFDRKLLMGDYCESLPADRVVLEIFETVEPDPALIKRLERLKSKGYRFALDDFVCSPPYTPLLKLASFVKIDVLASDWPSVEHALLTLRQYPVTLIAEKVETREQFERCREAGFRSFQGYFFCRPLNIAGKRLPPSRLASLRLLALLNKPDIKIEELEHTIGQDVALSYKLLRYINSAICGLDREVESIRHATVMVGLEKMRIWASLIVFARFDETPRDVIVVGAIRARMCELLATQLHLAHPERHFLVGLFSVLDAVLDRPMENVLSLLLLANDIHDALLTNKGELGAVLRCVQAYERRQWADSEASIQLVQHLIEQKYLEAVSWSAEMVGLSRRPA